MSSKYEDCHSAIEDYLTKELGSLGQEIHAGRSRNDQVLVAMRLYARAQLDQIQSITLKVAQSFLSKADKHASDPMPGYTHLQRGQPVTVGHHLLAYVEMLARDKQRLIDTRKRVNISPLGSGALAGSNYKNIDRCKSNYE